MLAQVAVSSFYGAGCARLGLPEKLLARGRAGVMASGGRLLFRRSKEVLLFRMCRHAETHLSLDNALIQTIRCVVILQVASTIKGGRVAILHPVLLSLDR